MNKKSSIGAILAGAVALSCAMPLAGCGGGGANEFSMWLASGEESQFYQNYEENPVLKYILRDEWGEGENKAQLTFDISIPPRDSRKDTFGNMIATQDFSDIMDISLSDLSVGQLYEQGVAMDITEYVNEYMPNYKALIDSDPELRRAAYTIVDGQPRNLHLIGAYKGRQPMYQGFLYRRDWIVSYGEMPSHIWDEDKTAITYTSYAEAQSRNNWTGWKVNPDAGTKFKAEFDASDKDNTYTDNVIYPSGNTEPVYISDWEWMFSIFEKAWAELNITDGYCYSPYYTGSTGRGDFASSFGGGSVLYYLDAEEGKVHFGGIEDRARAYVQCMNNWAQKGWLDNKFNTHSSDEFYKIDTNKVYAGKIGAWAGAISAIGSGMESSEQPLTKNMMVFGARVPINDIYGSAAEKWVEPDTMYQFGRAGSPMMITTTAKNKNLPALLSMFDYLYTEEGSRLKTFGLSKEQYEEVQDPFYTKHNLTNGAYYTTEENGVTKYHYAENNPSSGQLSNAAKLVRFPVGLEIWENVDLGYTKITQAGINEWGYYENTGDILDEYMKKIPAESSRTFNNVLANLTDYMYKEFPKIILGTEGWNVNDDASWNKYVNEINRKQPEKITAILQKIYDDYNF